MEIEVAEDRLAGRIQLDVLELDSVGGIIEEELQGRDWGRRGLAWLVSLVFSDLFPSSQTGRIF